MNRESDIRRAIPAVSTILTDPALVSAMGLYGRDLVTVQVRAELERLRDLLASPAGEAEDLRKTLAQIPTRVVDGLKERYGQPMRRVINATGILLHTNLGRAPLPKSIADRAPSLLDAYCDLEYHLESGQRGDRNKRVGQLLRAATGAEAGILVNNNAAALVLILSTLASGKEVVVSRGELVEIGGSFRIPDILSAAGVVLVEVGTTNRTKPQDYENAISDATGMLLKVFPSNYRQIGFTASVEPETLIDIGRRRGVTVVVDEGSGLLRKHEAPQLRGHPSLSELMAAGCDLACGSGDKLLGGPQTGLIVGKQELVSRCHRNPLYRALRPDRFAFGTMEEVLRQHLAGMKLPLDGLWVEGSEHRRRLESVAAEIGGSVVAADAFVGGGAAPERPIPGEAVAIAGRTRWLEELRTGDPPVVGYIREGRLILDLRTVDPSDDSRLVEAVRAAQQRAGD